MKKKFTFLIAALTLLTCLAIPMGMRADEVTLTSAQIKAGSGNTSYGNCSATDEDGNTWNAYAIKNQHSNATSDYNFWQIKKYTSNTAYYIQVPELGTKITSITMTVSNTSKPMGDGGNAVTLYFSNSNSTSSTGTGVASGTGDSEVTIDCSSLNLNSGYITASGAVRVWEVTVTYTASSSSTYTVTYNKNGGDDVTGSVPTDGTQYTATNNSVTVAGNTGNLAKPGNDWSGWCLNAAGTGAVYGPDYTTTYTISASTTFYAKWAPHTHDITMPSSNDYGSYTASTTTDVPYGTTVTLTYDPASGYENYVATWSINGDVISGNTFSMPDEDVTIGVTLINYVKDILNQSFTGVSGGYTYWTNTSNVSGAEYVGVSGGSSQSNYIQLNKGSYNSGNAGIITTGSGGKAKKVVVTWNSTTQNGRVLNIFGSNSAYSGTSDLYNENTDGDLLGTIVYGTSTELLISGDYKYIGIVTASNAAYLTEIDIYWEPSADPSITASNVDIEYGATGGNITYTINNPVDGATLQATVASGATISHFALGTVGASPITFTCDANGETAAKTATVTLNYVKNNETLATKSVTVTQAAAPVIYDDIEDLFNAATSTATNVQVSFKSWFVTGVSTNGKNVFVTDGTNGFVIFNNDGGLGNTYAVGDLLSSDDPLTVSLKLNQGYAQLTNVSASSLDITHNQGSSVYANVDMENLSGINTGALVHYTGLTCSITTSNNNTYYHLSDGTTSIQLYSSLYAFSALTDGGTYNITGVYQQYGNNTKEILPRSAADIVEVTPQHENRTLTISADSHVTEYHLFDNADQSEPYTISNNTASIQDGTTVLVSLGIEDGYVVDEITVTYGSNQLATITTVMANVEYTFTMPAANATLEVTTKVAPVVTNYTLVSSQAQLMPGKHYIIVGSNANETEFYAMGEQTTAGSNSKIRAAVAVTKTGTTTIQGTEDVCEFVISGDATSGWTIYDESANYYLKGINGNELDFSASLLAEYCYWTIDFNADAAELIQSIKYTDRFINFNNSTDPKRFANYKTTSNQRPVSIYVKDGDKDLELYSPTTLSSNYTITVPANGKLIVQANGSLTNTAAANLIIEDGGQLITSNVVAATVQKNISSASTNWETASDGWHFIASPVSADVNPTTVSMITDNLGSTATTATATYDLYYLDPTAEKAWKNYRNSAFNLVNGKGYLYASRDGITPLAIAGEVKAYTAPEIVDVVTGWNLIGNPFTFNVYANQNYYKMNENGTAITPVTKGTETIAPCTGVVVYATANGAVTFSKDEPVSSINNGNIQMTLAQQVTTRGESSSQTLDNAIVSFNEGSQLEKFYFGSQNANICIPQGNKEYAIVNAEGHGEVPVNFVARENGEYTLNINAEEVEMTYLHLIDNLTGADVDLLATPSYTFNARTSDYASRFKLVFAAHNTNGNENDDNFAFISDGQIILTEQGDAQVFDVMGRMISSHNSVNHITTEGMAAGVYVIRLTNGSETMTQKLVVK